ncbi:glycosyltransferase family 4 protein [Priestia koreensis]|uniref:glycosyltransferase family 4 protein n=1 Tax=Priestia koreensis TaxID=284581 RepID=UPI003D0435CB
MKILILMKGSSAGLSGADHMAIQTAELLSKNKDLEVYFAYAQSHNGGQVKLSKESKFKLITLPINTQEAIEVILQLNPDVIHLFDLVDYDYTTLALELALKGRTLIVTPATEHSLWEDKELGLQLCDKAKVIFALTLEEKAYLESFLNHSKNKVKMLPHAAYLPVQSDVDFRQKHNLDEETPIVLFLGRKLETKGYKLILESMEEIWTTIPNAVFVFIGPRTDLSIQNFMKYKIEGRVLELGIVSEEEKVGALKACNLLCLPSTVDVFPIVYLEAWNFSKPVIGALFPGVENVIKHNIDGLIIEPTLENITSALKKLLLDKKLSYSLGVNGRTRVLQEHSLESIGKQLVSTYFDCLERRV